MPYIETTALTCRGVRPNKRDSNAAVAEWFNDDESVGIGLIIDKERADFWCHCPKTASYVQEINNLMDRRPMFKDSEHKGMPVWRWARPFKLRQAADAMKLIREVDRIVAARESLINSPSV